MSTESTIMYGGQGPLVLGVTWSETGLAMILIILRARTASIRPRESPLDRTGIYRLRWDFIWVIIAFTMALVSQISLTLSVRYGLGNHQYLLSPSNLVRLNIWSWIAQVISILDLIFARTAIIAFLLSLQDRTRHWSHYILYLIGITQAVINITSVILIFRQCDPPAKLWDPSIPGTCHGVLRAARIGYTQGGINACSDFFLAAYPISIVRRIQLMKRKTKIGLCLIMGGGLIAGIAAIIKGISIAYITNIEDNTYVMAKLNIWVFTEMWFLIIFGSIPTLRMLFVRFSQDIKNGLLHGSSQAGSWWSSQTSGASGSGSGSGLRYAASGGGSELRDWEGEFSDRRILVTRGTSIVLEDRKKGNQEECV